MSLDVTGLPDYIDQNREELISEATAGAKSMRVLDLQTGFKGPGAINKMTTTVELQDGSVCARTPNNTTTLDQVILTPGEIKVEENLCPKELNKKYTVHQIKAGSKDDEIPFAKQYTDQKTKKIKHRNEVLIWQGDTLSGDENLKRTDGLIKLIDASAVAIVGNTSAATSITEANVIALLKAMYSAIPNAIKEEIDGDKGVDQVAILVGTEVFTYFTLALMEKNLFHYEVDAANMEMLLPGTFVKVMALGGLTDTNRMFAGKIGDEGAFTIGVDLENEEEVYSMEYSKETKQVYYDVAWKLGTAPKYPEEIVEFTLAV